MHKQVIEHRPPRIAMSFLTVALVLQVLAPQQLVTVYSSAPLSILLASTGFVVMMVAWWQFKEHAVAICPTDETRHLITDGIYRFTRNPMYLGMIMMLFSVATWFGTWPFYVAAAAYGILIDREFCQYEEKKLAAAFGLEYDRYRSNVRRWM